MLKSSETKELFEEGIPIGFSAVCPTCGWENQAMYGKDGYLVWWNNYEVGSWCQHATGCYDGGHGNMPSFLFR